MVGIVAGLGDIKKGAFAGICWHLHTMLWVKQKNTTICGVFLWDKMGMDISGWA